MATFRVCFPGFSPAEMAWCLENWSSGIRVLRQRGEMVGFSMINPVHGPATAWLEMIAVLPQHQGRGMGRQILQDYEWFASQLGYPRVQLAVSADNRPAVVLYEKTGYEVLGLRDGRLIMSKSIKAAGNPDPGVRTPGLSKRVFFALLRRMLVPV
ncbi:MAG: GNAT family N-acetyltransferase [Wenzhouxiangella sp.]